MAENKEGEGPIIDGEYEEIKEGTPQKETPKSEKKEEPGLDSTVKETLNRWEQRKEEPKKETKKVKTEVPIIDGSILGPLKERLRKTRFVGNEGMEKVCRQVYDSCTDEIGKLTVKPEELKKQVKQAREEYFTKYIGEWQPGEDNERGMDAGTMILKQYLGDIDEVFAPLEKLSPDQFSYELFRKEVTSSLNYRFSKKVGELDQYAILELGKAEKDKLKDELVAKVNALGKGEISRAHLISPESLVKTVIGLVQEETMAEQDNEKMSFADKYIGEV